MKAKFEYKTEDGFGVEINIEPTGKQMPDGPEFKAVVEVMKTEELASLQETGARDEVDMVMATGMRQVMEMISWPEMWEVETKNFKVAMTSEGAPGVEGMMPGIMFGGPMGEA